MNQFDLQKAIYDKLTAALPYPVFDDVPQNQEYPYIAIGEDTSLQWDTDDSIGYNSTLTIHAWSRHAGRKQVKDMIAGIYSALHRQALSISGSYVVTVECAFQETFMDSDQRTRHGVARYRIITEAKNV
jgi:hypothetical protein